MEVEAEQEEVVPLHAEFGPSGFQPYVLDMTGLGREHVAVHRSRRDDQRCWCSPGTPRISPAKRSLGC